LVIVSKVVKVFEETTKSVSSGLRSWTVANLSRIHNDSRKEGAREKRPALKELQMGQRQDPAS
jgi:hypothetical protein